MKKVFNNTFFFVSVALLLLIFAFAVLDYRANSESWEVNPFGGLKAFLGFMAADTIISLVVGLAVASFVCVLCCIWKGLIFLVVFIMLLISLAFPDENRSLNDHNKPRFKIYK